jgi:SAM-dependent methyltransferase
LKKSSKLGIFAAELVFEKRMSRIADCEWMREAREQARRKSIVWQRKPSLRRVYYCFHEAIRRHMKWMPERLIVELGSGIGCIKQIIPECITTDVFPSQWLDRQENAYTLSFPHESVGNLILFDVWHHLEYPGAALQEFWRVLVQGGRVILFEPAISPVGRLVYGSPFHPEPLALRQPIRWHAPANFRPSHAPYFAAQSRAARIFQKGEIIEWQGQWNLISVEEIVSFAYVLSGGFSRPQLYPTCLLSAIQRIDRFLARFGSVLATRLLISLEKKSSNA